MFYLKSLKFSNLQCDCGATAVEYAILVAGVALGLLAALYAFGGDLSVIFGNLHQVTEQPAQPTE